MQCSLNVTSALDQGCGGGFPTTAYEFIEQCGLESYSSYPYSGEGTTCQYDAADVIVDRWAGRPAPRQAGRLPLHPQDREQLVFSRR